VERATILSNEAEFERWLVLALERERKRLSDEIPARDVDGQPNFSTGDIRTREADMA
jgi:hypothetical protein